jgi:NADPH:quinone reductase-like Zn-dependent oxidoreductase
MKAWTWDRYGPPEVLDLRDTEEPEVGPGDVLVRVRACSVNPYDWRHMRADPALVRFSAGLRRPKPGLVLGADLAGIVERTGAAVTGFNAGDEVFGEVALGAFAEAVAVPEKALALKPAALSFEEAAAVPMAAVTALQGLRDSGRIKAGQRVLVNGAAGGIGSFAVQLARSFDAEVTGVTSTRNVELVRSLGADDVVDYTQEDFAERTNRYDLLFDLVANRPLRHFRRVLTPRGTLVLGGGRDADGRLLGPGAQTLRGLATAPFSRRRTVAVMARVNAADLAFLGELLTAGRIRPVIDRGYPFTDLPAAIRHSETGRARGKIVLTH